MFNASFASAVIIMTFIIVRGFQALALLLRCLIMLQDVVVTIHHQDARIHRIQNLLVIFLPLHLLLSSSK